jgi:hypothetical protein
MVRDPITGRAGTLVTGEASDPLESTTAAISWPAITGGAYVAASSSLILLALGSRFGLAFGASGPIPEVWQQPSK